MPDFVLGAAREGRRGGQQAHYGQRHALGKAADRIEGQVVAEPQDVRDPAGRRQGKPLRGCIHVVGKPIGEHEHRVGVAEVVGLDEPVILLPPVLVGGVIEPVGQIGSCRSQSVPPGIALRSHRRTLDPPALIRVAPGDLRGL